MEDIRVTSWDGLNGCLYEGSWQESIGRWRATRAFRGQSDSSFDLTTSLTRLGGAYDRQEGHLLRNFRKYAQRSAVSWPDSIWNWLALAQHHGLPTRMLDWTYSPYVAMHFATENLALYGVDGVIWAMDYSKTNQLLPDQLKQLLAEEGSDVFTVEMLSRVANTLPDFDRLSDDQFVIFLEPPSLDDRIVNQFALFSLMSSPLAPLDQWLVEHPQVFRRIIIPAELKWEVRDKLDQANITERVLFPGLDGLSRWLKRYYSPRVPRR